ncbi:carboxymuconolactone decarboxylase family protein [Hymenobacter terricola]|uniref:carboxymuconolactone decarboxylase family protein n=1 Tax=Hymenobacter terricola TaxID=2819236 RepID=UPI001B3164DB|nr:carboxymuconolactone decarboxylase family protein [Hymenobacter terricola]
MNAQPKVSQTESLTDREQSIVTISAFTAKGDLPYLHKAVADGLEAGLTVNEAKEVLVLLSAYCGFPRSLNGISTLMKVLDGRKARGIQDAMGKAAAPITSTAPKYESAASRYWKPSPANPKPAPTPSARKLTCF